MILHRIIQHLLTSNRSSKPKHMCLRASSNFLIVTKLISFCCKDRTEILFRGMLNKNRTAQHQSGDQVVHYQQLSPASPSFVHQSRIIGLFECAGAALRFLTVCSSSATLIHRIPIVLPDS